MGGQNTLVRLTYSQTNFGAQLLKLTLLEAISETDLWVWIVSSWSRHQSNSSRVSRDIRKKVSSAMFGV